MYSFSSPVTTFLHPHPPIKFTLQNRSNYVNFIHTRRNLQPFSFKIQALFRKSQSKTTEKPSDDSTQKREDFVTRVLEQNPSQVEPRFLIGKKLYTLEEKQKFLTNEISNDMEVQEKGKESGEEGRRLDFDGNVKLKDVLRDFRGKLYVPEQIFEEHLSEEEEFDRSFWSLPKIEFEDFLKALRNDKIKLLTFKDDIGSVTMYAFILELKEIPGHKRLHRTKWLIL